MSSDDGSSAGAHDHATYGRGTYGRGGYDQGRDDHGTRGNRVVPVYAFTRGRTRSAGDELPIEALVTATDLAMRRDRDLTLQVEWRTIIGMCTRPMSIAEIGIGLRVPITVARVLVGDLADAGYLTVHMPPGADGDSGPGQAILGRLLDGLRAR